MATDKKSVLLYCDIIHTVKVLSDEEAGRLFKHYLAYINDLNPECPDKLTQVVFEPIKQNLKRDLKKWESKSLKNSQIAKEGWDKRKNANASERINNDANDADKVTVTDTVIVTDTVKVKVKDIKEKLDSRKLKFAQSLEPYLDIYGKDLLNKFYTYWTEPNKSKTKFRAELEKTWDVEGRLRTWASREKTFTKPDQVSKVDKMFDAYFESKKMLGID